MSDDADRASEYEQRVRDNALRKQASRAGLAGKTEADSAGRCECGVVIPVARRRAVPGCLLCVACQARVERGNKVKA